MYVKHAVIQVIINAFDLMIFREFPDRPAYMCRRVSNTESKEFCDFIVRMKEPKFLAVGNGEQIFIKEWWDDPGKSKISMDNIIQSAEVSYAKFLNAINKQR